MPTKPTNADQFLRSGCGRCELGGTPDCKVVSWSEELRLLRFILQKSGLKEEIKWSQPCYTHEGSNIVLLSALKDSATVSFLRGALLKDPAKILEKPGENSRFARYARFTDTESIAAHEATLLAYVKEAIALEESGVKVDTSQDALPDAPPELVDMLEANADFAMAFDALTPGRQRGYLLHFNAAKQSKTRIARIEKCMPKIFAGKGWSER